MAARNGNFVTYAPASKGAKELMEKDYADNASIFPSEEQLKNGFMMNEIKPDAMKLSTRMWQDIKKGNWPYALKNPLLAGFSLWLG